jgi:hypothetical protein
MERMNKSGDVGRWANDCFWPKADIRQLQQSEKFYKKYLLEKKRKALHADNGLRPAISTSHLPLFPVAESYLDIYKLILLPT